MSEEVKVEAPLQIGPRVGGTVVVVVVLTLVGFVLAYAMALVVVKIGIFGPRLFVGVPLVVVATLAWASTAAPARPMARVIETVVAGGIAAAIFFVAEPSHPADMYEHESKVTDVKLHGDDATLTLESTTQLTSMPPVGELLALTGMLAALAVAGSAVGRGFSQRRSKLDEMMD